MNHTMTIHGHLTNERWGSVSFHLQFDHQVESREVAQNNPMLVTQWSGCQKCWLDPLKGEVVVERKVYIADLLVHSKRRVSNANKRNVLQQNETAERHDSRGQTGGGGGGVMMVMMMQSARIPTVFIGYMLNNGKSKDVAQTIAFKWFLMVSTKVMDPLSLENDGPLKNKQRKSIVNQMVRTCPCDEFRPSWCVVEKSICQSACPTNYTWFHLLESVVGIVLARFATFAKTENSNGKYKHEKVGG